LVDRVFVFLMGKFHIRQAIHSDLEAFWRVSVDTFAEAYSDRNKPEDIVFYNQKYFSRQNMLNELQNKLVTIFVNEKNHGLSGYVKLEKSNDYKIENALEIKRIYVRKEEYGSGLGKELMLKAIHFAQENVFGHLTLAVWKENKRAIAFYKKTGFVIHGETTFDWGTGKVDEDWVMVKQLS
jgi:ribosomal protein S18 acetylase RimI-like enzyme